MKALQVFAVVVGLLLVGCGDHGSCLMAELNGQGIEVIAESQMKTSDGVIALLKVQIATTENLQLTKKTMRIMQDNLVLMLKRIEKLEAP